MALAYFISFRTYGTWLHGDPKGSADPAHNVHGTPYLDPEPARERSEREKMTQPAYAMSSPEREIVCRAIVQLAESRGWILLAAHVRSNHVHVVIQADRDPGRLMSDLKARASRELTLAGFGDAERRRWTRHGSTRHLFSEDQIEAAIKYALDEQGERMAWYAKSEMHCDERTKKEPRTK